MTYEVTDGARGVIYEDHELRNAKISAARRSRIPHTRVRILDGTTRDVVATYLNGKPEQS